ncbi:putative quinol monooxygenase [Aeromonas sp. HMWF014]|uniref:putative quinol monooxygenase n=1 Tax=Aeromonas sp. HMWF014 TaxID=2056850 RepID=UPI000D3A47C2|nr:putative quinol monooxygenase [Aeromonas sp. HMWF014]PTT49471.1 antibiotic biosynthesis monooxygenase [Aeromonas sp. HMWF014]
MSSPVIVIAQLEAKPEYADLFRAALEPLMAATRQEAGCQRYQLHQDRDNPHSWMLHEQWESGSALTAHQQQPHFIDFIARAEPWLASSNIRGYQPLDA